MLYYNSVIIKELLELYEKKIREVDERGMFYMNNFCSSCGKALQGGESFCPDCGQQIGGSKIPNKFSFNFNGNSLGISASNKPEGIDWLAIVITGITALYMVILSWIINPILCLMMIGLAVYKRDVVVKALWSNNIFKPFIVHFIWGAIVIASIFNIAESCSRGWGGTVNVAMLKVVFILLLVIGNGVYYGGYRLICYLYKESKPQGQLVRMMVSMGLVLIYALIKRDAKVLDSIFASDPTDTMSTVAGGAAFDSSSVDMSSNVNPADTSHSVLDSINSNGMDLMTSNTGVQSFTNVNNNVDVMSAASTMPPQDTVVSITNNLSQPEMTMDIHNNGSADIYDSSMQHAGSITSSGTILNSLNIPEGRIDGNNIYDANNQLAFTIRNGQIYDNRNMPIGDIKVK